MRSSNKSRNRGRNSNRRNNNGGNVINRVFESAGPVGKVRGTPQQIIDKYISLAHDSQLSGDRVSAENFQQHAEHYLRILSEAQKEFAEKQFDGFNSNTNHLNKNHDSLPSNLDMGNDEEFYKNESSKKIAGDIEKVEIKTKNVNDCSPSENPNKTQKKKVTTKKEVSISEIKDKTDQII